MELMKRFIKEEEGQGLVEYALLLAGIAVLIIAVMPTLKAKVVEVFTGLEISKTPTP